MNGLRWFRQLGICLSQIQLLQTKLEALEKSYKLELAIDLKMADVVKIKVKDSREKKHGW